MNQDFKIVIIALLITFLILYFLVNLPTIHENLIPHFTYQALEIFTNVVIIVSVIVSPLTFFIKRWWDKRSNRKNAGRSILEEIKDIQQSLNNEGEKKPIRATYVKETEKQQIKFYPIYLEDAGFESAINSGHYTLFSSELQRSLNQIYLRTKLNNKTMDQNQELILFCIQHKIEIGTQEYYEIMKEVWIQLTKLQKELSEYIEITMNKLKEESN